jgi:hypothetical protein
VRMRQEDDYCSVKTEHVPDDNQVKAPPRCKSYGDGATATGQCCYSSLFKIS